MDNLIKVSVIIPVYNGKKFLENCLNILKNQDFKYKFEIILVNDASTDGFENYSKNIKIDNLKIYNFEKNRGQSAARNFGVKKSSGKYIFFMDVDDSISKNSLSSLYEFTLEDDYDYIFSDFQRIEDFQNQRVDKYNYDLDCVFSRNDIVKGMERELYDPTLGHLGLFGCNGRLIKKKIIIDNNILFEENIRWLEDKTFAWDVLKYVKKAKYIRKQLYSYYVNPNVKSAIIDSLKKINSIEIVETILKHVKASFEFVDTPKSHLNKLLNQGLIFFSIQILVSISRSILLKKIDKSFGIQIRKKIIKEIISSSNVNQAIKHYKPSKEESHLIPIAIRLRSEKLLELACHLRAKKVINKRREGKN